MIKIACLFFVLCACVCSQAFSCGSAEGVFTEKAKTAYTALIEKDWKTSLMLINGLPESSLKTYWLGAWYYAKGNDKYNPQTALGYWEEASSQGCFEAKIMLAATYFTARDPRIINISKSIILYKNLLSELEKKAEAGSATALCNLGFMYMFGIAVEKDLKKSFSLYERASGVNQMVNDCKSNHETLQKLKALGEI